MRPDLRLRAASLLALASAAVAQAPAPWDYTGDGFHFPTATGLAADHVEVLDVDGDGLPDLLALEDDRSLTANLDLAATSLTYRMNDVLGFAVTRTGGERIWAVRGGDLVEVTMSDLAGQTTPKSTGIRVSGFVSLIAQDRPGGARLLLIDQDGSHLTVFEPELASWTKTDERVASVKDGPFSDAALVDFDGGGGDWLATIDGAGLDLYDPSGALALAAPSDPAGAFLDVLPAELAPNGRDLLVAHLRAAPSEPRVLWLINAEHEEGHLANGANLREAYFCDFQDGPEPEMLLASGTTRDVWILTSKPSPPVDSTYFIFNTGGVFHADLDVGPGGRITAAPAGAVADVDGDGDSDLVLIDDQGEKIVLTSTKEDDDALRPAVEDTFPGIDPFGHLSYSAKATCPPGYSSCSLEVRRHVKGLAPVTILVAELSDGQWTSFLQSEPLIPDSVYHFIYRVDSAVASTQMPAYVTYWSPTQTKHDELMMKAKDAYAWFWIPFKTGGTTRTPIIDPPPPILP